MYMSYAELFYNGVIGKHKLIHFGGSELWMCNIRVGFLH